MSDEFNDLDVWLDEDDKPSGSSRTRKMNIFFLIDKSGSMRGEKIESVNQVMPEALKIMADISQENKDNAEVVVSALLFSNGTQWMYPTPVSAEDFVWRDQKAGGGTDLGMACRELEKALHRNGPEAQLISESGHKNPAIILLSDGEPTDDYRGGLEMLKKNNWFKSGYKVAIAIGTDANYDELKQFTGTKELVIGVKDVDSLKQIIKVVTAVVSRVGSQSTSVNGETGQVNTDEEIIIEDIKNEAENIGGATIGSLPTDDEFN